MGKRLDELHTKQIVSFELTKGNKEIDIMENCDEYFDVQFNKKEFGELIEELMELHSQMKED